MRHIATATMLMLLASCGESAKEAEKRGENAALDPQVLQQKPTSTSVAGVDFGKRVEAFGTEPYWLLGVEPGKIEFEDFSIEDGVKTVWPAAAPKVTGNVAAIETRTPQGEAVTITLTGESCLEVGGEENTLPLKAQVKIGARILRGCAGQKLPDPGSPEAQNAAD
ncbi:hypothetical protein [Sphingomonas sp.]|uniref:hypothetical protein n=1 Tax=Sphingomonas sp. TaxID=28214 RepID=UPI002ED92C4F